jgi:outer membrane protein TolC
MRTTNTLGIQFIARSNKSKNGLLPLNCRITVDVRRVEISLKQSVDADLILKQSQTSFKAGEIGYSEYLLAAKNALGIKESYLRTLSDYNQAIIYIEFLSGNK